jgi:hypothetical protein
MFATSAHPFSADDVVKYWHQKCDRSPIVAGCGDRRCNSDEWWVALVAPAQQTGMHRHPCPVVGYVAREAIRYQVEGQPAQEVAEGGAFFEPASAKIVRFDNASTEARATFVAVYLMGTDDRQLIEMLERPAAEV